MSVPLPGRHRIMSYLPPLNVVIWLSWSASSTAFFTVISKFVMSFATSAFTESSIFACQALFAGGRETAMRNLGAAKAASDTRAATRINTRLFIEPLLEKDLVSLPLPPLHEHREENDRSLHGPRE